MDNDKQVIFHLILWAIITLIVVFGLLYFVTDADADEQKFTATFKFENLTIQQIADLDKWIKNKYPESILEIESNSITPQVYRFGVPNLKYSPDSTTLLNLKSTDVDSVHWYKRDGIYEMNVDPSYVPIKRTF